MTNGFCTSTEELRNTFRNLNLVGRTVTAIDIPNRDSRTKSDMANTYNFILQEKLGLMKPDGWSNESAAERYRKLRKRGAIRESEIPLDLTQTRLLQCNDPFELTLDNQKIIQIGFIDSSKIALQSVKKSCRHQNLQVNASRILAPALGKKIAGLVIKPMRSDDHEIDYSKNPTHGIPIKSATLVLEGAQLYFSWPGSCCVFDEVGDTMSMTLGEYKNAITYYEELFA